MTMLASSSRIYSLCVADKEDTTRIHWTDRVRRKPVAMVVWVLIQWVLIAYLVSSSSSECLHASNTSRDGNQLRVSGTTDASNQAQYRLPHQTFRSTGPTFARRFCLLSAIVMMSTRHGSGTSVRRVHTSSHRFVYRLHAIATARAASFAARQRRFKFVQRLRVYLKAAQTASQTWSRPRLRSCWQQ